MKRISNLFSAGLLCVVGAMVAVTITMYGKRADTHATNVQASTTAHDAQSEAASDEASKLFPVLVRKPDGPPRIELAGVDPQGRSGSVACSTCHAVRPANLENVSANTLDEFHQGMTFNHGKIACYACHNPDGTDTLRLADGRPVDYTNVMTLCAQCHGPQMTAFKHGAHGGMNGHWDLTRGPQMKNNCIDCHDPHEPSYPKMVVDFKPKDRFNEPSEYGHEGQGHEEGAH